ncbi:MAG: hypothetical protein KDB22_01570 [Planctomycetales bacterium]|nr:hypothetical protein [Planctomycetales bacterium]
MKTGFMFGVIVSACACLLSQDSHAQFVSVDLEDEPIRYSKTDANNRVSKLVEDLAKAGTAWDYEDGKDYLSRLLKELGIPVSSQVLVFSQTSMQVQHISPRNPRAIYFNDDTYVGWIHGSSLVEISTNDPQLGAAFYTLRISAGVPRIHQETHDCLACHATTLTQGVPGHTVRSGYPNYDGAFDLRRETYVTDETSNLKHRWGGWYVTGSHGDLKHMGNAYLRGGVLDTTRNGNRQSLDDLFDVRNYLAPRSDIQALMVLEHQTQMHNTFTRADFSIRSILHEHPLQDEAERAVQLRMIAKEVVDRLLFCNEFSLTYPITGSGDFEKAFLERGPADASGRSLREFDMRTRMFKYPLSYLIYSQAFDALQPVLRHEISQQLQQILDGENQADEYSHLTMELRSQIREIVRATKPDLLR